ncbi:hypothetical protein [Glaciecola sp. 1036]|uniref:hypothetical protein n=1 Tax=Alteromonadaceae TaxID=72275 RepID=UPI003D04BAD8
MQNLDEWQYQYIEQIDSLLKALIQAEYQDNNKNPYHFLKSDKLGFLKLARERTKALLGE